jgi:RHS repeat-associated protein
VNPRWNRRARIGYVYDGDNLIAEANSNGAVVARYTQSGNIDEPARDVARTSDGFLPGRWSWFGCVVEHAAGLLAQTHTFDSCGKQTTSSGSLTSPFLYSGRESYADTGLYYFRECYFDPTTGRFLSEALRQFAIFRIVGGPEVFILA